MNRGEERSFTASAWKAGTSWKAGTFGLRILDPGKNRERFFRSEWTAVTLHLTGVRRRIVEVSVSPSFWRSCPEMRSSEIGEWLHENGHAPWPKGQPRKFIVTTRGEREFVVKPL